MDRDQLDPIEGHGLLAIIGVAGRFPGAPTVSEFWQNIAIGKRSIRTFSFEELRRRVDSDVRRRPGYVSAGSILETYDQFDASFFGYTPREAEIMDPQHRLFLECAWEALEDAGYANEQRDALIGVFAGSAFSTYLLNNLYTDPELLELVGEIGIATGNDKDSLASTVSYKLNLKGPSVSVQTFCSTSLVSVHLACQSLLTYECDLALAGGVAVQVPQGCGYEYQEGGILSPDGHCRTFDARASGSVMGSGVGLVVLKRLDEALRDGDQVCAVIRGSAVNNDGGVRAGYTAPSVDGQAEVIAEALSHAGVEAETIGYIEAHGTATPLGDAVELAAMIKAFRGRTERKGYCAIGSVKPNVGHLDRAAGITGLIKTVQALRHKQLPPQIDYEQPNPDVDLASSPFYVNTELREWPREDTPRRAGVSSFGLGGTNAHVVLEEAPEAKASSSAQSWELLVVSAKTPAALERTTRRLADKLAAEPGTNLGDVAYTLQVGRCAFNHRRIAVCRDTTDAASVLSSSDPQRVFTMEQVRRGRPVAFMFPGLGDQYTGMARELYQSEPAFREAVDECSAIVQHHLGIDLRTILFEAEETHGSRVNRGVDFRAMLQHGPTSEEASQLKQTRIAQPAVFVIDYAMVRLLHHWGVDPVAVIGHSLGEYVAATVAGVLSLPDALHVVCRRAELIGSLPMGSMLAVALSDREVLPLLPEAVDLAAANGGAMSVVAGPPDAIGEFEARLSAQGIACRIMETIHAFHSRMLSPVEGALNELVEGFELVAPKIPCVSNVTGTWMTTQDATDPKYWGRHMCSPVRFCDGLNSLLENPDTVILEVGPGQSLGSFAKQHPKCTPERIGSILATLPSVYTHQSDVAFLQLALGRLWLYGVDIDWQMGRGHERRRRVALPTYPFDHERYWREPKRREPTPDAPVQVRPSGKYGDPSCWFYAPDWKNVALVHVEREYESKSAVLFGEEDCLLAGITKRLRADAWQVFRVVPGNAFAELEAGLYTIRIGEPDDYTRLLTALSERGDAAWTFVHALTVAPQRAVKLDLASDSITRGLERSFYSMLALGKALAWIKARSPIEVVVLSNGIQALAGDRVSSPFHATIAGVCRVLPQECAGIICRLVDTGWQGGASVSDALLDMLTAEIQSASRERSIVYRNGQRFALKFRQIPIAEAPTRQSWREHGVYVITGGLGGIGLTLAKEMARQARARVALISRSRFPSRNTWDQWLSSHDKGDPISRKVSKLIAIEALGGEILILGADVCDENQLSEAINLIRSKWGEINGIVHAAGVSDPAAYATIRDLEKTQCEAHFAAKIRGLCVLHRLTEDESLDFRIAFSSLSGTLGGLSFAAYAAANIFMDGFASSCPEVRGAPWISVEWDSWKVGESTHGLFGATVAAYEMTPTEGVQALEQVIEHELPTQIMNSTGDLMSRYAQWVQLDLPYNSSEEAQPLGGATASVQTPEGSRQHVVAEAWKQVLGIERIDPHDNFFDLGGNSLSAMQLVGKLARDLKLQISIVSLFEAPTIAALTRHLFPEEVPVDDRVDMDADRRPRASRQAGRGAVAIVGMSGRFPGAPTIEAFWNLLASGKEAISQFSDETLIAAGVDPALCADPAYVKARPILDDIKKFDAEFFGYNPREAELMDPQHRLFMECASEALENAGYDPDHFGGLIGIFGGCNISSYLMRMIMDPSVRSTLGAYQAEYQAVIGNDKDSLTTSVSYKLNLKGPSFSVQTFCSTSLVATHLACRSLLGGECDMALAGGVSVRVPDVTGYIWHEGGMESPDGHCRAFDAKAGGTLFGDGVAVVVLKRLEDALEDRDTIHAVIRGSAVNNDGSLKVGYTAPSVIGQADVVVMALESAELSADEIDYVEAHGTGTTLGDPIEVASLTRAFRRTSSKVRYCRLGSVKPNIGHLDRAAGVASLIKVVLALQNDVIPPSINFDAPNPEIDFENSPFIVNASTTTWPRCRIPRRAGINSLGMGGTNAHVVLEEAPTCAAVDKGREVQLLVVSARTEDALEEVTKRLAEHLRERNLGLADVAYTLQMGRKAFEHRRAVVCRTVADAVAALESPEERVVTGKSRPEFGELEVSVDLDQLALRCRGGMPEEAARWEGMKQEERELGALLETVGRLWVAGARIEWDDMYGRERRRRVPLPTYPFERKRYWVETSVGGATPSMGLLAEEPEKKTEIADWFYVPSWKRSFVVGELRGEDGWWVLLGEGGGLAGGLAERLRGRGVQVVRVEAGERFAEIGEDRYTVRPTEREDYTAVLDAVRGRGGVVRRIVHLWLAAPAEMWHARGIDTMTAALDFGFHSLMALAQVLGEQPGEQHRLVILTSELQDVASGEVLCAEKAVVLGPCLVVPQEYAHIRCRSVDVDARDAEMPTEVFLERLERELTQEIDETVVALRGADRWVQEVAPARLSGGSGGAGLRQGGVYLITGGLGGIGMAVAEYLYRTVHARLVLVGRTAERNSAKVEALRSKGAEVLVQSADVGDRMQMEAVIEKAEERFGKVHGVIHTAGVPPSGLIQRKTREMAEEVMRPKLQGVLALAEVLRSRSLDFLCLFSSMSSMTGGGPGQVDYCAGNAFMDAFARQHFAECGMTFSIAWGEWQWNAWEDGLSGFPEEARQYFIEKRRAFGLSFEEGTEAFLRILNHRIPNTFVATQDFGQMVEGSKNFSIATILDAVTRMRGTRPTHPRPALAVSYVAPASEAERRLSRIWCDLLGFSEVGINDNFFDLGGNSLLGVDLIARISSDFELAVVPAHLLYEAPTIATLAVELGLTEARSVKVQDWNERSEKRREKLRRMRRGV